MARLILIFLALLLVGAPVAAIAGPVVVGAAIGAGLSVGVGVALGTVAAAGWMAAFGTAFVTNLALGALSGLLARKPEMPSQGDFSAQARGRQVVIRSATEPRRIVYGEVSVSGPLTFATVSGAENEYLHLVVPLAGHEVDGIPRVFLGDDEIGELDANGNCIAGKFAGFVRCKKYLGTSTQEADTDLIAESGGLWTSAHRGLGVAYVYLRLRFQQDIFPSGIPNVRAIVRGKKLYDPRDGATRWSPNWALVQRDYLAGDYGLACSSSEINDASVIAAANICDERVLVDGGSPRYSVTFTVDTGTNTIHFAEAEKRFDTGDGVSAWSSGSLPSGLAASPSQFFIIRLTETSARLASTYANALAGTAITLGTIGSGTHSLQHVDQARYTAHGVVTLSDTPESIIKQMLTAGMGAVVYQQGEYRVYAGAYRTPVMDLDEDNLSGGLVVRPRIARADLYNGVRGTYVDPQRNWQATDFPPVTNSTYEAQDGGEQILRDVQFPFTTNVIRAQRLAKIILERSRQSISVQMPCNLSVLKLAPWDTVRLSIDLLGWSSKVFMVLGWQFNTEGGIDLQLQEEASAVYDWNYGDATLVDPAPDTNLPSVDTIRSIKPGRVSGLQLFGDNALATEFTGRDAKFVWRRGAVFGSYPIGMEQFGAGDGGDDFFFKDFKVTVYKTDGTELRTEYVIDNAYTYTFEKNSEDTGGSPVREFGIKIWARSRYGQLSELPATLEVSNPAPTISGFAASERRGGFDFSFTQPTDPDYAGIRVYADPATGFTANASTLMYQGSKIAGSVQVPFPGMAYKLKYVPYDVFGDGSTSAEVDVTTLTTLPANQLAALGRTGIVSSLLATSYTTIFGFAPSTVTAPVFDPATGLLIIMAFRSSTGHLWLAAVSPVDHTVAKLVDTGTVLDDLSVDQFPPVRSSRTGKLFQTVNRSTTALVIEVDPQTLSVTWSGTANDRAVPMSDSPLDGLILFGGQDLGGQGILWMFDPEDHTWGATATMPGSVNQAVGAAYVPSSDTFAIVSNVQKKVLFYTRGLSLSVSYTLSGSPTPANTYLCVYCPTDDRVWVEVADTFSTQHFEVITPTGTLDTTVTATKVPGTLIYCPLNGAVVGNVDGSGFQFLTYNPVKRTEMVGNVVDAAYYPDAQLCYAPATESLHSGALRVADSVRFLLKFSL